MSRLDGKIAIVTGGAGSGIGHGIFVALGKEGACVAILEIDLEAAKLVRERIEDEGGHAAVVRCDVSQPSDVRSAIEQVAVTTQRPGCAGEQRRYRYDPGGCRRQ